MSNSLICDDIFMCDPFIENEVVVMEDDDYTRNTIKEIIEREFRWQVITVNNQEEAVNLVGHKQAAYFILDNCIGNNKQEGFKTLKAVKELNPKAFVAILTEFSSPDVKQRATNLDADSFKVKSLELKNDIYQIATEMLKYKIAIIDSLRKYHLDNLEILDNRKKDILNRLEAIDNLDKLYYADSDSNILAYEKHRLDQEWLSEHEGKYVAFVDGRLVGRDENKQHLLEWLKNSKYQASPIFLPRTFLSWQKFQV
jgi:DNA-binding NarL/FixJ family response regulator